MLRVTVFVFGLGWLARTTRKGLGNEEPRSAQYVRRRAQAPAIMLKTCDL